MAQQGVNYRSDHTIELIDYMGDDLSIVEDARTSLRTVDSKRTLKAENRELSLKDRERIEDFIRLRHASTLRGQVLKVHLETTIAMQRQIRTHWVGNRQLWPDQNIEWAFDESDLLGFNDQSGKYTKYKPTFYIPSRHMMKMETDPFDPMQPTYRGVNEEEYGRLCRTYEVGYESAWYTYTSLLEMKGSREQSRFHIPEGIFVAGRMTLNLNAALGLMSLRINDPGNATETYPQEEIEQIAIGLERIVRSIWPVAHAEWVKLGRPRP